MPSETREQGRLKTPQVILIPYILSLAAFSSMPRSGWRKITLWIRSTETRAGVGPERGKMRKKSSNSRHSCCYAISTDFTGTLRPQGWHGGRNRSSGIPGKLSWKDSQDWHPPATTLLSVISSYTLNSSSGLAAGTQRFIFKDAALYFVGIPMTSPRMRNRWRCDGERATPLSGTERIIQENVLRARKTLEPRSWGKEIS